MSVLHFVIVTVQKTTNFNEFLSTQTNFRKCSILQVASVYYISLKETLPGYKIQNKLKYAFLQIPGRDSYVKKNIFNFRNRFQIFIYLNIQW